MNCFISGMKGSRYSNARYIKGEKKKGSDQSHD